MRFEDAVGRGGECCPRCEERAHEPVGRHARPGRLEHAVEVALRSQSPLDVFEASDRSRAVHAAVLLVEAPQQVHAKALPCRCAETELGACVLDELAHLALPHPDERAFETDHELLGVGCEPRLGGAPHHVDEPDVGLQRRRGGRVANVRDDAVDELADRALLDEVFAEGRQHVRDVLHERPVRPDDEDAARTETIA